MKNISESRFARILILMLSLILGMISYSHASQPANCKCDVEGTEFRIWYLDSDGDGLGDAFNARISCSKPFRYVDNSLDLDDTQHDRLNECSKDLLQEWYKDQDNDGFGDALQVVISTICPPGYVGDATDLNDNDETIWFDENAQELITQNKAH
jgi:hypothetical protein